MFLNHRPTRSPSQRRCYFLLYTKVITTSVDSNPSLFFVLPPAPSREPTRFDKRASIFLNFFQNEYRCLYLRSATNYLQSNRNRPRRSLREEQQQRQISETPNRFSFTHSEPKHFQNKLSRPTNPSFTLNNHILLSG